MRKLIADGALGDLRDFTGVFTIPRLPDDDIRYQPAVGGGALLDMGIYPIRSALYYLGSRVEVVHAVLRVRARTGAVVSGRILACTPGGVTVTLRADDQPANVLRYFAAAVRTGAGTADYAGKPAPGQAGGGCRAGGSADRSQLILQP